MLESSWIQAAIGGVVIGLASSVYVLTRGSPVGISGMVGDVLKPASGGLRDSHLFLVGLAAAGLIAALVFPSTRSVAQLAPLPLLALAGSLVGFGTRLGGGCTSGHGVSGISRFSVRSIVATVTFIALGALVTLAARHALGVPS